MANRTRRTAIDGGFEFGGQAWTNSAGFESFPGNDSYISIQLPQNVAGPGTNIVTIWEAGFISFGPATQSQINFAAGGASPFADAANGNFGFPGEFIAFSVGNGGDFYSYAFGQVDFDAPYNMSETQFTAFFQVGDGQVVFSSGGFAIHYDSFATAVGFHLGETVFQEVGSFGGEFETEAASDYLTLFASNDGDILFSDLQDGQVGGFGGNDVIVGETTAFRKFAKGNGSFDTALDLDEGLEFWSDQENALFGDASIPHTTVRVHGENTTEYFRIFVAAGETLTIDVDYALGSFGGVSANSLVTLFDAFGTEIIRNNNADNTLGGFGSPDDGPARDSFLTFTATVDGFYTFEVRPAAGGVFDPTVAFLLNISLTNHVVQNGEQFAEYLFGDDGDDQIFGNLFDDEIIGGRGNDLIHGGGGTDRVNYRDAGLSGVTVDLRITGPQLVSAELGTDTLISIETIYGSVFNDILTGNSVDNTLFGDNGNDILMGSAGNDTLDGGAGFDAVNYADATSGVRVNLATNFAQNTRGAGTDSLFSIERVLGSAFDDQLFGNAANNRFDGGNGADRLTGGDGNDVLNGNAGNDVLSGGAGEDTMMGGADDDSYFVDSVFDTVTELANQGTRDMVTAQVDFTLGDNVERLLLVGGARVGTGNGDDNTIFGTNAGDTLTGLGGADVLRGNGARDAIDGGAGADIIDGGAGRDTLTGGADRDLFQFRDGDTVGTRGGADFITDFDQTQDERIQLSLVDANGNVAGNQDFEWIATAAFGNVAGELRYQQAGGNTYVEGDLNGDGVADYTIALTGLYVLDASDFTGVVDVFP